MAFGLPYPPAEDKLKGRRRKRACFSGCLGLEAEVVVRNNGCRSPSRSACGCRKRSFVVIFVIRRVSLGWREAAKDGWEGWTGEGSEKMTAFRGQFPGPAAN